MSTTPTETGTGTGLALSPDGKWLATPVKDFDTQDQTEDRVTVANKIVNLWSIDPSPAGGFMLPEQTLRGHTRMILSVAFSPDGRYLASSTSSGEPEVVVWDATTLQPLHPQPLRGGHNWPIYGIALSADGLLASASVDGTVRIWDVRAGRELIDPPLKHAGAIWAVAFSPDGQLLASAGFDRVVKVWEKVDAQTWNCATPCKTPAPYSAWPSARTASAWPGAGPIPPSRFGICLARWARTSIPTSARCAAIGVGSAPWPSVLTANTSRPGVRTGQ